MYSYILAIGMILASQSCSFVQNPVVEEVLEEVVEEVIEQVTGEEVELEIGKD